MLIERYHQAGIPDIVHNFYPGGRHEMLNEINRGEVRERLVTIAASEGAPADDRGKKTFFIVEPNQKAAHPNWRPA